MLENLFLALIIIVYFFIRIYFSENKFSGFINQVKRLFGYRFKSNQDILRECLEESNTYFRSLSEKGKLLMMNKCFAFMKSKNFIGMEGLKITDEMIATISGTAAQLTFGLKKSSFSYYHTIKIFPESFYSRMLDHEIKGGASTSGVLFFSWKDFKEGYADYNDKYNLGLHEMAHALRLELKYGSNFDSKFANYADHWIDIAMPEFERMNKGNTSFLRDYAATNVEELFAVCIEHFFEVPHEFKQQLPDIYNHLCFLLNQDPTNIELDHKLSIDFAAKINATKTRIPIPDKVEKNYKYDSWHWSSNFIVAGLFLALPVLLIHVPDVMINNSTIVLFIGLVAVLVTQFRNYFYSKGIFLYHHLVMFAIIGAAIPASAAVILINKNVVLSTETNHYKITGYTLRKNGSQIVDITYEFENNELSSLKRVRKVHASIHTNDLTLAHKMIIESSTGLLGFNNIRNRLLVFERDTIEVSTPKY